MSSSLKPASSKDRLYPGSRQPHPNDSRGNACYVATEKFHPSQATFKLRSPENRRATNHRSDVNFHDTVHGATESRADHENHVTGPGQVFNFQKQGSFTESFVLENDSSFDDVNDNNAFSKREGSSRSYIAQIKDNISKYVNPSLDNIKQLSKDKNANIRPISLPKPRAQWSCQTAIPPPQSARKENPRNSYGGQTSLSLCSSSTEGAGRNRNSIDSGFTYTRQGSFANHTEVSTDRESRRQMPAAPITNTKTVVQSQSSFNDSYNEQDDSNCVEELYTVPHTYSHQIVIRQKQLPPPPPPPRPRGNSLLTATPKENQSRNASFQGIDTPRRPRSDAGIIDDVRRRTWSPATFNAAMGNGTSFTNVNMRSYHSNDALDDLGPVTGADADTVATDTDGCYADLEQCRNGDSAPPKIAPVSGRLQQNAHKTLIKPIAFKPAAVAPQTRFNATSASGRQTHLSPNPISNENSPRVHSYGSNMRTVTHQANQAHGSPPNMTDITREGYGNNVAINPISPRSGVIFDTMKGVNMNNNVSHDDGYVSQDYTIGQHSHSNSNTSHNGSHNGSMHGGSHNGSMHNDSDRSIDRSMEQHPTSTPYTNHSLPRVVGRPGDRPESFNSSSVSRVSGRGDSFVLTPSPSDSGLGELEAMLRDKDATILHLRETMERNETAILQVCVEKEQNWEQELREIHEEWQRRWRHHTERAGKMEQALLQQLFKLQQERKALKLELETLRSDMDKSVQKCNGCEKDLTQTRAKLEEVNWELAQKSGEIALLKTQLKDSKDEASTKGNDIVSIKTALKQTQHSSDEKDHEILTLEAQLKLFKEQLSQKENEISALKRDCSSSSRELANVKKNLQSSKQQVDLKELQMEMKCKELECLQAQLNNNSQAQSSSPKYSPIGAIAKSVNKSQINSQLPTIKDSKPSPNTSPISSPEITLSQAPKLLTSASPAETAAIATGDIASLSAQFAALRTDFMREREQWLDEKNKVIRYQKHLQLNYVQMYRKNKVLEAEVEQLTLELEKRDVCMMEPVKEAEESVC